MTEIEIMEIGIGTDVKLFFSADCLWYDGEIIQIDGSKVTIRSHIVSTADNDTPNADIVKYRRDITFRLEDILAFAKIERVI